MIGVIKARNEIFCDLCCWYCQGFRQAGCLFGVIKEIESEPVFVSMFSVMLRCMAEGKLLRDLYKVAGLWDKLEVMSKEVVPGIEFLTYKKETVN